MNKSNINGTVISIERFSLNDGPGIRTTVFLKGCPLDCIWCHNPESKNPCIGLSYKDGTCIKCGKCKTVCDSDVHSFDSGKHKVVFDNCNACNKCVDICPTSSLKLIGKKMTVNDVVKILIKDIDYYNNSEGGVTISGGEPMHQYDFTYEILKSTKKNNINTCIETCGVASPEKYIEISKYTDLFLYDIKASTSDYKKYTGTNKDIVLKNLKILSDLGKDIVIRCPLIPGINDNSDNFNEIIEIAANYNVREIEIMPYHDIGKSKAIQSGEKYPEHIKVPDTEQINEWIDKLQITGLLKK